MAVYHAVTTCNAELWASYGRAMANTFARYWPKEVPLWIYAEGFEPDGPHKHVDLERASPWLVPFKAMHTDPGHRGHKGGTRYDFRWDAVRFSHKIAAIGAAAGAAKSDVLIWLDADTVTHSPVSIEWLDKLFPEPAAVAWLDRHGTYPECGFLMFRLPQALPVIREVVRLYRSGEVVKLPQTHDSYVFQQVVQTAVTRNEIKVHSLSGDVGRGLGHVFIHSVLSEKMDHLKGTSRKEHGRTHKHERRIRDNVAYWR